MSVFFLANLNNKVIPPYKVRGHTPYSHISPFYLVLPSYNSISTRLLYAQAMSPFNRYTHPPTLILLKKLIYFNKSPYMFIKI